MDWNETRQFLAPRFPEEIRTELDMLLPGELREIRIRTNRPTVFVTATRTAALRWSPDQQHLEALVEALSEHSLYARQDETRLGYLTLRGGHRMGICGQVQNSDGQSVLSRIGSVCIRIASEWTGAADPLTAHMNGLQSVLIIGAPGSGKTTMLRDLARQLASSDHPRQVAIIDERSELAACVAGVPQLDVGASTDVLDGLPKAEAIPWLIRSLAPQVIITDELAGEGDAASIIDALNCGITICASAHGASLHDARIRPALAALFSRQAFDLYAVLNSDGGGLIDALYDSAGNPL